MSTEKQQTRRREIEAAAYEALAENGYKATSMLAIARRASASNETLYKWYGNKQGLFRSLVEENAREVKDLLENAIEEDADPLETISNIGPLLLQLIASPKAIVLNRAAVSDVHESNTLGKAIAAAGKETLLPLLSRVFQQAMDKGQLRFDETDDIATIYISLLVGDLQIQRAIGVRGPLKKKEIQQRADKAFELIARLFGSD